MLSRPMYIRLIKYAYSLTFLLANIACSGQPNLVEDVQTTLLEEDLRYYLYYPENYNDEKDQEFGLLLFLHGGGEAGGSLEDLQIGGPPKMIVDGKKFPFLILAPQHPHKKQFWNTRAVKQLLDSVIANNRVDTGKIYLTGLSRGGSAAWEMAVQYPETFAAMAVVCGMTPLPYASWIDKKMPIWVFHGAEDPVISVAESEEMVEKLETMGYQVRFTKYEGVGHDAWTKAYNTEELYSWFVQQKRKD